MNGNIRIYVLDKYIQIIECEETRGTNTLLGIVLMLG